MVSLHRVLTNAWYGCGRGGGGSATLAVSSGVEETEDDATDDGSATSCGEMRVGGTVDTSEAEVVDELKTESRDDICRKREPRRHLTSGALTRTGVRRGRIGERTRMIEGDFARSLFVTTSAATVRSRPSVIALFAESSELEVSTRLDSVSPLKPTLMPSSELCAESLRIAGVVADSMLANMLSVVLKSDRG